MAFGKNSRPEGRKNGSSYCSTITIIVFVALCLVAVWVMTTSSMVPEPNKSASSLENGAELKDQVTENDVKPFEDGFGDLSEDAQKGENSSNQNQRQSEETTQKSYEETQKSPNKDEERNTESGETRKDVEPDTNRQESNDDNELKKESPENASEEHQQSSPEKSSVTEIKEEGFIEEKVNKNEDKVSEQNSIDLNLGTNETFPDGAQSEILNETISQNVTWLTQATESNKEKKVQMESSSEAQGEEVNKYSWKLCNTSSGADYIPCLDNEVAIKQLHSTKHYEHRERHCPDEGPTCLVPLPEGYKQSLKWPKSREKIWYSNVPHIKLAEVKGHQNWVKASGEYLTFPGGGTQFKNGALHYIDFIQESLPDIAWGKQSRVVLDVGCGVASFGGYLFERDVLAMSFAPKDEHEAQVQFALERGIPAISAVMGTRRLPFPSKVFDIVHCARCRVPWHIEGGKLLLELNRVLRPGGYFVWSATPVYQNLTEDVEIWEAMSSLTKSMCWEMMSKTRDNLNQVGVAIYKKPMSNDCYQKRTKNNPPVCKESDDPDAAWNVPLQPCMHRIPTDTVLRGSQWPEQWPKRLDKTPYWLNSSQIGVYGKTAPEDFISDYNHWKRVVKNSYLKGMGINWSHVRNVMDMRSVYGGFAAALRNMKVWVMNVVPVDSADTLPIIYDRGLFGIYHDWCESFNTYPRTYDLLHADHLFSKLKKRCKLESVMAEVDRILRPEGNLIVRDSAEIIKDIESMAKSMSWEIRLMFSEEKEGLLCVHKTMWRPVVFE